jgi:hypothetical protein
MQTNYKGILGISLSVAGLCLPDKSGISREYIRNAEFGTDRKESDKTKPRIRTYNTSLQHRYTITLNTRYLWLTNL